MLTIMMMLIPVGQVIPEFPSILAAILHAHTIMVPDVPLVGWDVALTPEGPYILELNISCNFFNGHVDREGYAELMYAFFSKLDACYFDQLAQMRQPRRQADAWRQQR